MAKMIKNRSIYSVENFKGLNSEDSKIKVSPTMAVEMSNLDVESGVLKTRPSVDFKKVFATGYDIIDYYNMYYSSDQYNTILVTKGGFFLYDTKYKKTYQFKNNLPTDNNDNTIRIFTNVVDTFAEGSNPVFQQEKDCLFIFCLEKIYVIALSQEQDKDVWFLYKINNKPNINGYTYINDLRDESKDFYKNLPEPYVPLISIAGDTVNSVDDVNLISDKRKYNLFAKSSKSNEGYYEYDLPSDFVEKENKTFDYELNIDAFNDNIYSKPVFYKSCLILSLPTSEAETASDNTNPFFTDATAKVTFLNDEEYTISNFLDLLDKKVNMLKEKVVLFSDETPNSFSLSNHKLLFNELKKQNTTFYKLISEFFSKDFSVGNHTNLYVAIPFSCVYELNNETVEHDCILFLYMPLKSSIVFEDYKYKEEEIGDEFDLSDFAFADTIEDAFVSERNEQLISERDFNENNLVRLTRLECLNYRDEFEENKKYTYQKDFISIKEKLSPTHSCTYDITRLTNQYLKGSYLRQPFLVNYGYSPQITTETSPVGGYGAVTEYQINGDNFVLYFFESDALEDNELKSANNVTSFKTAYAGNAYSEDTNVYLVDSEIETLEPLKTYYKKINGYMFKFGKQALKISLKDITSSIETSFNSLPNTDNHNKRVIYFKTQSFTYFDESDTSLNSGTSNTKNVYACLVINYTSETTGYVVTGYEQVKKARVNLLCSKGSSEKDNNSVFKVTAEENIFNVISDSDILDLYSNDYTPVTLTIKYEDNSKNYDKIAKCTIGTTFGLENRLVLAGNSEYPNIDRYNVSNDILDVKDKSQSYELSYFPAKNHDVVGGKGKINSFSIASDSVMYITKEYYPNDSVFFVRTRNVSEEGKIIYNTIRTSIDKTAINHKCFKRFLNDSVILTKDGLFGVELTDNYITSKRLIMPRDSKIKTEIVEKIKLCSSPELVVFGRKLYIVLDNVVYVTDYTMMYKDVEGNVIYNFVKWQFNRPIKQVKVLNDELEFRYDNSGVIYKFGRNEKDSYYSATKLLTGYEVSDNIATLNFSGEKIADYSLYKLFVYDKINSSIYEYGDKTLFSLTLEKKATNGEYSYETDLLFDEGIIAANINRGYTILFVKEELINFYYLTPVLDFDSPVYEKTLFEMFFYSNRLKEDNHFNLGYRTMNGYNELLDTRIINPYNPFDLNDFNFETFTLSSFTEFGAKKGLKINNFLYLQFALSGNGRIEISGIKMLYKNNRIMKTIG